VDDTPTPTEGSAESGDAPEQKALDAARALLAEEERARMMACSAEIQDILDKYGLSLEVSAPQITLVPRK
jgi:hypothetical protein